MTESNKKVLKERLNDIHPPLSKSKARVGTRSAHCLLPRRSSRALPGSHHPTASKDLARDRLTLAPLAKPGGKTEAPNPLELGRSLRTLSAVLIARPRLTGLVLFAGLVLARRAAPTLTWKLCVFSRWQLAQGNPYGRPCREACEKQCLPLEVHSLAELDRSCYA